MGKKVSARIKNRIKQHFARSINHLEKSVARSEDYDRRPQHRMTTKK